MHIQTREQLFQRYTKAKGDWYLWRDLYEEAYAYTCPQRNPWPDEVAEGRRKNLFVYDTTAIASKRRLDCRIHASILPPSENWFELTASEQVPVAKRDDLNAVLSAVNAVIYKSIGKSNFDLVANELIQDLTIGIGAMMILEDTKPDSDFRCKSIALNLIYPEGDAFDEISTVWRDVQNMRIDEIEDFWPKAVIPRQLSELEYQDQTAAYDFIEGYIYLREEDKYRHVVFCEGLQDFIVDSIEDSSPWLVARWSKSPREVGGRGPVIDALPTIRSLNKLIQFILENVALSTSPPWLAASDGVFNPYMFEIAPNKIIPISRQSMGSLPLQKLDVSGDIQLGSLEVNDMRTQIKDILYDNPIRPVNSPEQTATEISIRHQAFLEEIGPAWGRLSNEFLPKIIKRVIYILQRKGKLDKKFKVESDFITIRYKSPLEQGKAFQDLQNFLQYMQIMNQNFGPQAAAMSLNLTLLPAWIANKLDVDPALVKTTAQIEMTLQVAQQQAQMQQAQANGQAPDPQISNTPNPVAQGYQQQMQQQGDQ